MKKTLLLVLCALSSIGCVVARTVPSTPKPETRQVTADFTGVLEGKKSSSSVYFPVPAAYLRRTALSPNLVFEAARSTTPETATAGPEGASAAGRMVEPWLSSTLLKELKRLDATPIPTVALRGGDETCGAERCPPGSWVERILERHRRTGGKELAELPTAILAVRDLELGSVKVPIFAERSSNGDLYLRLERKPGQLSDCPDMTVELPVLRFTAEALSPADGKLVARIVEAQLVGAAKELLRRVIDPTAWEAQTTSKRLSDGSTILETRWKGRDVTCENAVAEYAKVRDAAVAGLDKEAMAREVVARGLAPLAISAR